MPFNFLPADAVDRCEFTNAFLTTLEHRVTPTAMRQIESPKTQVPETEYSP